MRKNLTFIPLGIGISAAIIYLFNVIQFRVINNGASLLQILSNLKVYLYISIISFLFYFIIKILFTLKRKNTISSESNDVKAYESFEILESENKQEDDFNYDDFSLYEKQENNYQEMDFKYCFNCGQKVKNTDNYCFNCGKEQKTNIRFKSKRLSVIKNLINVLEIVILILIIYFSLNMLFSYKQSRDPNFKSPFKESMIK